jgi:hypothetical protein
MAGLDRQEVAVVAGSYGIANPEKWLARCVFKEILWRHTSLMPDFPNAFGSYNFCVKKSVFDAVGGFNTGYRHASGEDNDLSYKIVGSGQRIYFQPKALVDHYHPTRAVKYLKEQFYHGFWRVKMYKDHPRMMRPDGYTYWKDILEVPLAGGLLLLAGLGVFHCPQLSVVGWLVFLLFLVFEILSALIITRSFWEGFLFGFVLLFRAFARTLGFLMGGLSLMASCCLPLTAKNP